MNDALSNVDIDLVQYLYQHRTKGCTTAAMDYAAENGHLNVVRFLHENRSEDAQLMRWTWLLKRESHFWDVVKYLVYIRTDICTTMILAIAAEYGHLDVVRYLDEKHSIGFGYYAIDKAAMNGHLEIIQYLVHKKLQILQSHWPF
ncbi:hypothetical protein THRCLA_22804 [Thraustotheca clavata]|uniref:Uncharacterized protein n=1 Tax=Thraustotheca clavata TaxID=74557 RepID=A0A1V9YSN9_9STRA|nr:hypothetical protein THRCLA_22804 [Thraustotheca clavata]